MRDRSTGIFIASYGNDGYTPDKRFTSREAAIESICKHKGWDCDTVVESDSFTTDDGEAVALYETQEACDADQTGAYAPWVEEVLVVRDSVRW